MDDTVEERAREAIERARLERDSFLDLSAPALGGELDEIPEEVFRLSELKILFLGHNNIHEVPERFRELRNLKYLSLIGNPVEVIADIPGLSLDWAAYLRCRDRVSKAHIVDIRIEIDDKGVVITNQSWRIPLWSQNQLWRELTLLPNLRSLLVTGRRLFTGSRLKDDIIPKPAGEVRHLIDNIGALRRLERLTFYALQIYAIPTGVCELRQLQSLGFDATGLRHIPDWIGDLEHLHTLSLRENDLTTLPTSIANLLHLEVLDLSQNQFTKIPEIIFELANLETLGLDCHNWSGYEGFIKQVPADILKLPRLKYLDLRGQPVEVPPPEVVKEGVEDIKNYWRQQQEVGVDYLAEAKLIIVGEAGAGKTSLAKKIKDSAYKLKPQEPSTEGIDVVRWSFPTAVRVRRDGVEELHPTQFKASIWDFGGQEIYHATHQFFLTRRSLYALVADDRKEDTDFNYWLQVVEMLSDGSPLLIVQNEKQDRQRDIDLGTLRAQFPNLRETFRINLATNRGLDQLATAIRQELERLPHIGTPLPRTWSMVRAALETDTRHYISLDEYLTICEANGFTRREDKLQLSGYLHDLGIFLHFQDDPVLKNTVILKPKWGTDAVYSVLDDHIILNNRGRFGHGDLARIWADPVYAPMHDELLRLMMRFQLCYALPGTEAYIAPQMLSPTRPVYEWNGEHGLVVRYEYEFMPKGILTRFIVGVNHLIMDQDLVWKSGVILARDGARAEVIEDYPRRRITVRVSGADARGLLAIVDDQLERIHATFPRLKYEKYLPCNCEVCQQRPEPFAYPLTELKDFAAEGHGIQCRASRRLVDAAELLREVLPSAIRPEAIAASRGGLFHELHSAAESAPTSEVFVSYAWTDESKRLVDRIEAALAGRGVSLLRDRNELRYRDSIRSFMERIGRGKCIVIILSRKYLESPNCMFEITEIAARGDIRERVFPIVLPDADIYAAHGRLGYIKHWEQKRNELDAEMKGVGGEFLQGIREDLDLYAKIRHTIAHITDILRDMNVLTVDEHQGSDFDALIQALEQRLSG